MRKILKVNYTNVYMLHFLSRKKTPLTNAWGKRGKNRANHFLRNGINNNLVYEFLSKRIIIFA